MTLLQVARMHSIVRVQCEGEDPLDPTATFEIAVARLRTKPERRTNLSAHEALLWLAVALQADDLP